MNRFTLAVVCLSVIAGACGGGTSSPSAPSQVATAETWSGTVTDNLYSPRGSTVTAELRRWPDNRVNGYWSVTHESAFTADISGEATPSELRLWIAVPYPYPCQLFATARVSGSRMTGQYVASDPYETGCSTISGTFELTRR